jgi:drug/metabolite transporter (DMT)-like permease
MEPASPATTVRSGPGAVTTSLFAIAVVLGGTNFVAVRFSNRELPPFWGAGLRFMLAAAVFVLIVSVLRLRWPRGKALGLISLYGLFSFAVSYALMYWALVRVSAGMAAVVLAAVPLVTALLAAAQKLEPLTRQAIIGATAVLAGILWKATDDVGVAVSAVGLLAMFGASLSIGQSIILGKRVSAHHPALVNAVGMLAALPVLLGLSFAAGEAWGLPRSPEAIWAVTYLVLLGSVGMFILVLMVVRKWTASATSYGFVLFPIVTMLIEAWLEDVPLTARGLSGALLVMGGVWFGVFARPGARTRAPV